MSVYDFILKNRGSSVEIELASIQGPKGEKGEDGVVDWSNITREQKEDIIKALKDKNFKIAEVIDIDDYRNLDEEEKKNGTAYIATNKGKVGGIYISGFTLFEDERVIYLAKDNDFQISEGGILKYIGTQKIVNVPHIINGSPVTSYKGMFADTDVVKVLSDNPKVTNYENTFESVNLDTLDLSEFIIPEGANLDNMFVGASIKKGYAHTPEEAEMLNNSTNKPSELVFKTKEKGTDDLIKNWEFEKAINEEKERTQTHIERLVASEGGVHGFRFFDRELQVQSEDGDWLPIDTSGRGVPPANVVNPVVREGNEKLFVWWGDPEDTIVDGQTISTWEGTKLVMKVGSYPQTVKDGTLIVDNKERNKYKNSGFEVKSLNNDETYYFTLFPYSDTGAVNPNPANRLMATPKDYKIMTVKIDLLNSNPATCCTYADDAVNMIAGDNSWDDFFGHYPVLFKEGKENGKLNRNNFNQYENGEIADIESGDSGDVMIAFPRLGLNIETIENTLTISMTNNPVDENFTYYAHTRGEEVRDKFYLGAYKGEVSRSGKDIIAFENIDSFRDIMHKKGAGYELSGFYQLVFRQAMYILKYRNLDSQTTIARGAVRLDSSEIMKTGGTEDWGMDSEIERARDETGIWNGYRHSKLFGIEDFWGNVDEFIDGIVVDADGNILTATDNFNTDGVGYENIGDIGGKQYVSGYMSRPYGTNKAGFLATETNGSETTYFCDKYSKGPDSVIICGGDYNDNRECGIFKVNYLSKTDRGAAVSCRLMYL